MPPIVQYNILFSHNFGVVIVVMQVKTFARAYKKEGEARFEDLSVIFAPAVVEVVMLSSDEELPDKEVGPDQLAKTVVDDCTARNKCKGKGKTAEYVDLETGGPSIQPFQ